ncbi:hypothetical protein SEA_MEMENTOMORI_49 [Microbacterium phage MementoMori]|uniref:Uncharacterized protein n=1 Tax=Microbacterium phage MementoMori TaxID=2201436 RepID=A0A2Z4Q741_9CAUD|nr:hypothetical protein HOT41_gp60 [Microbacterium phage MementoMori]AWY05303.1 hypothetical protein SEA_MEMENTOMORI_49 [Microbacterium phage MementoMori]
MAEQSNRIRLENALATGEAWQGIRTMSVTTIAAALDAAGVFLPPEGAIRTEGRAVEVTPQSEPFPYGGDIEHSEGRMYASDGTGARRDVTDTVNEWAARQPAVVVVTYEWPEPRPICPECRDGKHGNCTGEALHEATDVIVECGCDHAE